MQFPRRDLFWRANYIGVRRVAAAAWYFEKLGLRKMNIEMDSGEGWIALGFSKDEYALTLGPPDRPTEELTPILYSPNVKKAREFLSTAPTEADSRNLGNAQGQAPTSTTTN
jgi:hypothetical protein